MKEFLRNVLTVLINGIDIYGYYYIAIPMFAEGLSIPFPSLIILLIAGFLVSQGQLNLLYVIFIASVSYTIASNIPYLIGYNLNKQLFTRIKKYIKIKDNHIDEIRKFFEKYGEKAVCISRPVMIGNYISYFAGMNKMPIGRFNLYTFIGIAPWAALMVYIGSRFGSNYRAAYKIIKDYIYVIDIFAVIAVAAIIIWKREKIIAFWHRLKKSAKVYRKKS